MNIDEYRAQVAAQAAQEAAQTDSTPEQPDTSTETAPPAVEEETPATPSIVEPTPDPTPPATPEKIVIDGDELTLDEIKELRKSGLRLQDYTRKTQEVASQRKEAEQAIELYNQLRANPQVLQAILQNETVPTPIKQAASVVTPEAERVQKLEQQLADMQLQREIDELSRKYDDFDVVKVLNTAATKNLINLEDAYKLTIEPKVIEKIKEVDMEAITKQIREQVLADIERDKQATQSIISSNDAAPVLDKQEPVLTEDEARVAARMKMSPEEYLKWSRPKK